MQWPIRKNLPVWVVAFNRVQSGDKITQILDSVLMQFNMRAWHEMKAYITKHSDEFEFWYSATNSGNRGFAAVCKHCDRVCKFEWHKKDPWDAPHLEPCRMRLRHFFGFGTQSCKKRQRIV